MPCAIAWLLVNAVIWRLSEFVKFNLACNIVAGRSLPAAYRAFIQACKQGSRQTPVRLHHAGRGDPQ